MARKKEVQEEVQEEVLEEQVDEPIAVPAPIQDVLQEELIQVRANGSFHDGAFKNDFAKYGYSVHLGNNEVRSIPAWLYMKLMKRSGGRFSIG